MVYPTQILHVRRDNTNLNSGRSIHPSSDPSLGEILAIQSDCNREIHISLIPPTSKWANEWSLMHQSLISLCDILHTSYQSSQWINANTKKNSWITCHTFAQTSLFMYSSSLRYRTSMTLYLITCLSVTAESIKS